MSNIQSKRSILEDKLYEITIQMQILEHEFQKPEADHAKVLELTKQYETEYDEIAEQLLKTK